jgi:hypothetical protein
MTYDAVYVENMHAYFGTDSEASPRELNDGKG